jgi:hypothetical protein
MDARSEQHQPKLILNVLKNLPNIGVSWMPAGFHSDYDPYECRRSIQT